MSSTRNRVDGIVSYNEYAVLLFVNKSVLRVKGLEYGTREYYT